MPDTKTKCRGRGEDSVFFAANRDRMLAGIRAEEARALGLAALGARRARMIHDLRVRLPGGAHSSGLGHLN